MCVYVYHRWYLYHVVVEGLVISSNSES